VYERAVPGGGGKRQKELLRKKRLDAKRARLAARSEARRADRAASDDREGPRCGFCGGPLVDPQAEEPAALEYGGHPICASCWASVPRADD
jgi:hypothetical protein